MSDNVTVITSATGSILVPFTSAANAASAQAAMDTGPNSVASLGGSIFKYFIDTTTGAGNVTLPVPTFLGGVAQTGSGTQNYGLMPGNDQDLVNAGNGTAIAVGGAQTSVWAGQHATTIFLNSNANGAAFLGGGNSVLSNAFSFATMNIQMDSGAGTVLGNTTLIVDDTVGGGATVTANANALVALIGGGADLFIGQAGTTVLEASSAAGAAGGTTTVQTAGSGSTVWVGAQGVPLIVNPGAGDAFVFQGTPGQENAVTLFGGQQVFGGQTLTAAAETGRVTVAGMDGFLQAGSQGGSIVQTGTDFGAATALAGGSGDILFIEARGDTANLGNASGVIAVADTNLTVAGGTGDTFIMGNGEGEALGAPDGHNTFIFTGSGTYTVAGFHDTASNPTSAGFFQGSTYVDSVTAGGGGTINIVDFAPQQVFTLTGGATVASAVHDTFNMGSAANLASLTSTTMPGGLFSSTAVLHDGTTIIFGGTTGMQAPVQQNGSLLQ
jgi:hypothetical protein